MLEGLGGTVVRIKDARLLRAVVRTTGCSAGLQLREIADGLALLLLLHSFQLLLRFSGVVHAHHVKVVGEDGLGFEQVRHDVRGVRIWVGLLAVLVRCALPLPTLLLLLPGAPFAALRLFSAEFSQALDSSALAAALQKSKPLGLGVGQDGVPT